MIDRTLARGLFLAAVALFFGIGATRYSIGTFAHAGPGLFPLMVSCALGVVAVATLIRSRLIARETLDLKPKNVLLLMVALCGFAILSKLLDMVAGIVFMVFVASLAARTYSWKRCALISAGLIVVAFGFQKLLGLNLPLL